MCLGKADGEGGEGAVGAVEVEGGWDDREEVGEVLMMGRESVSVVVGGGVEVPVRSREEVEVQAGFRQQLPQI